MSSRITSVMLDTNVWLDYFLPARPGHDDAINLVDMCIEQGVALLYASTSAKDVFFLSGQALKHQARSTCPDTEPAYAAINEIAWSFVSCMRELATPVGVDASDFWLAERYRSLHSDFEDNLVLAAVERAHADLLVTSDAKLITHAPCTALTPADAAALIKNTN